MSQYLNINSNNQFKTNHYQFLFYTIDHTMAEIRILSNIIQNSERNKYICTCTAVLHKKRNQIHCRQINKYYGEEGRKEKEIRD